MGASDDEDIEDAGRVHHVGHASLRYMCALSVANFGISAAWGLLTALVTPFFTSTLGASAEVSRGVWMCGPLSGLAVAPLVGYYSDRCTHRLGRRRPFILAGALCTLLSILAFARSTTALAAFLAFAAVDVSINTTMNPVRALQGDLVPAASQPAMQAVSIVAGRLGDLASGALIANVGNPLKYVGGLCAAHGALYLLTHLALCAVARERRVAPPAPRAAKRGGVPRWLWPIGLTYACGFAAFFLLLPNFSTWYATAVCGGDPHAPAGSAAKATYDAALSHYGRASMAASALGIAASALYPVALRRVQPRTLVWVTFGAYGALALLLAGTKSRLVAAALIALYSLPLTALATVPTVLAMERAHADERATVLAYLAWFCCVPQLLDTAYSGALSRLAGEAAVIRVGGAWSIAGAAFSSRYLK